MTKQDIRKMRHVFYTLACQHLPRACRCWERARGLRHCQVHCRVSLSRCRWGPLLGWMSCQRGTWNSPAVLEVWHSKWRAMFSGFLFFFPAWLCGFCGFCGCVAFVALPCFTYLPIYLFIYLSIYLFIYLSIYLFTYLSIYLSIYLT